MKRMRSGKRSFSRDAKQGLLTRPFPGKPVFPALLFFALSLVLSALCGPARAAEGHLPDILVLHSHHPGSPRTDGLSRGIAQALSREGQVLPQMVVFLDAQRLGPSPDYPKVLEATRNTISVMAAAVSPKVVVVTDWTALGFWREHRDALAPGVPVVYCGTGSPPPWVAGMGGATGVVERLPFGETLRAAMKLRPGARKLLVLESSASYFASIREQLDRELAPFASLLEIHRHQDQDINVIEKRLAGLGDEWIVLAVGRPEHGGVTLTPASAARRVSQAGPAPVFATWKTWMGHGVVGGRVVSSEEQGRKAGEMAMNILQAVPGPPVNGLPPVQEDSGAFLFDHAALARFGMDEKLLPAGSALMNRPVTFYEENRQLVWLYGLVTALLAVAAVTLALYAAHRRKAQSEMAANMNFIASLMEAMPTPMFYKDARGVYQGCNRAMEAFLGMDRSRLVGHTVQDIYPPEEAEVFRRKDEELFRSGPVQIYEFDKATPSGRRRIRFHKALYYDSEGRPAGLVGVIADITDLRNAEQEVARTREYLQAIIDSSPSAIFGVNAQGVITHTNIKARELCQGRTLHLFEQALPRMAPAMGQISQAIAQGHIVTLPRQLSTVDGKLLAEDVMAYPLHAIGLSEAIVRIDDVTGRHRMEELVAQSEKMMSVGGLAAGMAHEINNPLGGVMQSAQVIASRMRPDLPANLKAAREAGVAMDKVIGYLEAREIPSLLEGLRSSAKRAAGIVANMLEFSRRSASAWLPVAVNGLMDKSLELCLQDYNLSRSFDFKHIRIVKDYDPADPSVPCSAQQIQQVVFNLLRNAAQALFDARTPDPTITLSTRLGEEHVVLEVADNGPGMDEAVRRKVFEPFFTTKPPGFGTGLGLSVSYFIVHENHGGEIEVESEPGKGARFMVSLPLKGRQPF